MADVSLKRFIRGKFTRSIKNSIKKFFCSGATTYDRRECFLRTKRTVIQQPGRRRDEHITSLKRQPLLSSSLREHRRSPRPPPPSRVLTRSTRSSLRGCVGGYPTMVQEYVHSTLFCCRVMATSVSCTPCADGHNNTCCAKWFLTPAWCPWPCRPPRHPQVAIRAAGPLFSFMCVRAKRHFYSSGDSN